jgi:hypothetical protein
MNKTLSISASILSLALLPALALAGEDAAKSGKSTTLSGCLSGPNTEGAYTLKTGAKDVEVEGADLKGHVGHEVKLTGTWTKTASDMGTKTETSGTAEKKHQQGHFKVTNIQHVSETCTTKGSTKSESDSGKKSGY